MGALADDSRLLHARGQHGVDGVGVDAGVAQHDLRAGDEEVHDLGAHGGRIEGHALGGEAGQRLVDGGSKRDGPASSMFTMPMALRRSANGSEEPVGPWPTANRPQMVSSLSARATSWPTVVSGSASPAKRGW